MFNSDVIKQKVTMNDVAEMYGIKVKSGNITCPLHEDKNPSLHIYPGDRGWFCYSCHKCGSVIDFVMIHDGVDFKEAIKTLGNRFNVPEQDSPSTLHKTPTLKSRYVKAVSNEKAKADKYVQKLR